MAGDTLLLPIDLVTLRPSDPLGKGWNIDPQGSAHFSKEIVDDYQDFITKLKLEKPPTFIRFYADKAGRRAVTITLKEVDGDGINYTLIYDRLNARTKVVKWREVVIRMG